MMRLEAKGRLELSVPVAGLIPLNVGSGSRRIPLGALLRMAESRAPLSALEEYVLPR